jgi:hypothetical protein
MAFTSDIDTLRNDWPSLSDVDRAHGISNFLQAGISCRALAKAIGCSEALLRHIRPLRDATEEEKNLLRCGETTTNAVLRFIKQRTSRTAIDKELSSTHEQSEHDWAYRILDWASGFSPQYAKQVFAEARSRCLVVGEREIPAADQARKQPIEDVIERCRPHPRELFSLEHDSLWLTRWALYAIDNSELRVKALTLASERSFIPPRKRV